MSAPDSSRRKSLVQSSTLTAAALLGLALLAIVNYFGWKYFARFDWTPSRIYTLSEKTGQVLGTLDSDIEAVVFMTPADELYDPVRELLSRYQAASSRISVRIIDPDRNPAEAQSLVDRYEVASLDVVVFDSGDDRRVVETVDLADYDYSGMQFGQSPRMTGFKGEQAFTGAILELAESVKPSVLFTTGHGEIPIDDFSERGMSQAKELLGRDNFELASWGSLGEERVPEATDLVVIAGPRVPFVEPEADLLRDYLAAGGRLLLLIDPPLTESGEIAPSGLESLLEEYGVTLGADLVVDPANPLPFYGAETIFADRFGDHPITRSLDQAQIPVILPVARSVSLSGATGVEAVKLVETTDEGWGETNLADLGAVGLDDGDLPGPVALAVAVSAPSDDADSPADPGLDELIEEEAPPEAGEPDPSEQEAAARDDFRLVVVGDSDFATNGQLMNVGNAPFLANALNWLVERETLVGIPAKEPEQTQLTLSSAQLRNLILFVLVLLPGIAVASGIAVYLKRRR